MMISYYLSKFYTTKNLNNLDKLTMRRFMEEIPCQKDWAYQAPCPYSGNFAGNLTPPL